MAAIGQHGGGASPITVAPEGSLVRGVVAGLALVLLFDAVLVALVWALT